MFRFVFMLLLRLGAFAVRISSTAGPRAGRLQEEESDCLAARLWLKSGAVHSVVKKAIVAICLVVCGTATTMVPKAGDANDRANGTPIPVTNGQRSRSFWLTV